jgi:hypothetical protein
MEIFDAQLTGAESGGRGKEKNGKEGTEEKRPDNGATHAHHAVCKSGIMPWAR